MATADERELDAVWDPIWAPHAPAPPEELGHQVLQPAILPRSADLMVRMRSSGRSSVVFMEPVTRKPAWFAGGRAAPALDPGT
jgi:hypothetical protein